MLSASRVRGLFAFWFCELQAVGVEDRAPFPSIAKRRRFLCRDPMVETRFGSGRYGRALVRRDARVGRWALMTSRQGSNATRECALSDAGDR